MGFWNALFFRKNTFTAVKNGTQMLAPKGQNAKTLAFKRQNAKTLASKAKGQNTAQNTHKRGSGTISKRGKSPPSGEIAPKKGRAPSFVRVSTPSQNRFRRPYREKREWKAGCTKRIWVQGRNVELLVLHLRRAQIPLLFLEKREEGVLLEVAFKDYQKVFAILRKMCYNIKRETIGGKGRIAHLLFRRVGALFGALVFVCGCALSRPVVFSVEYRGGAAYRQVEFSQTLAEVGVKIGTTVTKKTLMRAKNVLYEAYPNLYFVSVEKHGFRVVVTAEGALPVPTPVFPKTLLAPCDGVVVRINLLRGKAQVCVGDVVFAGTQLACGELTAGETQVETYVLGEIVLLCKHTESVVLPQKNEQLPTMLLHCSLQNKGVENPVQSQLFIAKEAEGFRHVATYTYAVVVRGG